MSSFSDTELSIIAVVLSIIAVYLNVPLKNLRLPQWLRREKGEASPGNQIAKDFAEQLRETGKKVVIFYGSQTGTAEEYATSLAKEIKARYGLSSLVCDPEDYEFHVLDALPSDALAIFVIATYGEGEPTDNAVGLVDFLTAGSLELSKGSSSLSDLKYLMFGLGNSTYEHFCETSRILDHALQKANATRIGPLGEGDDDGSLEEDYLAWKELIWAELERKLGWQEGGAAAVPDFEVRELETGQHEQPKVYLGELSKQALLSTRGIQDAKNPFLAPILAIKELFQDGDRNCVSVEFDIRGSGMRYQTGDHLGIWPLNPDREVERALSVLGLEGKRDQAIEIISLDAALAKVPTPSPTTYDSVLRYYLDISQLASRQAIHSLAKFAPSAEAKAVLERLGTDKDSYHSSVAEKGLRLADVLILAAGDDPSSASYTKWDVPFSHILSCVPRLQPRFYSISSSSRLHPDSIHVTVVVAKSRASEQGNLIYGLGSNYLLNLKQAITGSKAGTDDSGAPKYAIEGPRGKYKRDTAYSVPIHTRSSKFRLPKSVKIPLVMIGPGTGVAPFRAFIQDRIFLARRAKASKGPDALQDWATMDLFYGCRRSDWDFLYRDEFASYLKELDGKFRLHVAFSREPGQKKVYVQQLVEEQREKVVDALVEKKGYLYICGDAKHMAREVEATLESIIGKSMGGGAAEGARELKVLKERKRVMLDVWS